MYEIIDCAGDKTCGVTYPVIYEDNCSCGESYVGETMRNVEVRTAENNDPTNNSEPARHLKQNKSHKFTWKVIYPARKFF